jgi:myo-inositol-1(or 4)-monophosphatase
LLGICHEVVDAVEASLGGIEDLTELGGRPGQYALDVVADRAALEVLNESGIGVLSEESGLHRPGARLVAVLDPVDGSTNASRGLPWYATSICIVEGDELLVSVVANLATKERYHALRGEGAYKDGQRITRSSCTELRHAIVALSGFPRRHLGWAQFRAFGAAALDLCAVADGTMDAFVTGGGSHLAPWDYLGGALVCLEAGAQVSDLGGQGLVACEPGARRAVAAAASPELMHALVSAVVDGSPSSRDGRP